MGSPLILPTAAGLCLVGAALGVYLGNASINEINPAYFEAHEPRSRFYADLTPQGYRDRDWASVQEAELRAAQLGTDLGTGCVGCRTYPEEGFYRVYRASLGKSETGWAEVEEPAIEPATEAAEPDPQTEQIERYASFPVTAEEERQQLAMADASQGGVIEEPGDY